MKKDDIVTLTIDDIGTNGEGIGRTEGITLFIKDALPGDMVRAKIMKMKKTYGYARLMEILKESTMRTTPPCPEHKRCGGCQIQALSYESQLKFKENKVRNNLKHIGGFENPKVLPTLGMQEPYRYRNKAQFPVGYDKEGNLVAGFFASRTHNIIPVQDCLLGKEGNGRILSLILDTMKSYGVSAYDEKTGKGCVRHILIRYGEKTGEWMVCFVINGKKLPHAESFIEVLKDLPGMTSITVNINESRGNVILGEETYTLYGQGYITDYIGTISFQISPQSFYQVNPAQTEVLYNKALEYANLTGEDGLGFILRYRNHFLISGTESEEGLRCGNCTAGNRRCQRECPSKSHFQCRIFRWESRGSLSGILYRPWRRSPCRSYRSGPAT